MSKELRDKAERIMKELEDALVPIAEEIKKLKYSEIPVKGKNH